MELFQINWLAVVVSVVVSNLVLGFLWYSPALFAKPWMKAVGITPESMNSGGAKIMQVLGPILSVVLAFVTVITLAVAQNLVAHAGFGYGFVQGLLTSLGFGVAFTLVPIVVTFLFESRKPALYFIDIGYHLVGMSISGIILALWR